MKRLYLALALVAAVVIGVCLDRAADRPWNGLDEADDLPERYAPGEVVVRWRGNPSAQAIGAVAGASASSIVDPSVTVLRVPEGNEVSAARALSARPDVEWAEPNYLRQAQFVPNDPLFDQQWSLTRIQAPEAWETALGSPSVVVAIVDTGIDLYHPDLREHLVEGFNVLEPDTAPLDDGGHGTHIAGTIGATINNSVGIAGIASGVSVMPVKVLNSKGSGKDSDVAAGMRWAVDHGARVVNLSFNGYQRSRLLQEGVIYAASRDVIVVAAVGNDARSNRSYPASIPPVIAVGASNDQDQRTDYSNFGDWVDIAAPGDGIVSTSWDGQSTYKTDSGTSMAASEVTGVVALLLSAQPGLTTPDVRRILKAVADPIPGGGLGAGRLNAARALRVLVEGLPPPTPVLPGATPVRTATAAPTRTATPTSTAVPSLTPRAGHALATTYNAPTAARTVYLPAVLRGREGWTSQISVQNVTSSVAAVTLDLLDSGGSSVGAATFGLAPFGSAVLRTEDLPFLVAPWAGAGVVRSDMPVAVTVNLEREGFDSMAYDGQAQPGPRALAPFVLKNLGGWTSAVFVQNTSAETATVELLFRTLDGAGGWTASVSLPPAASWAFELATSALVPDGFVGSAIARSREDLPLAVVVASVGPSGTAFSFAGASAGASDLSGPEIMKNRATSGTWNTAIVLQNPENEPASVTISYTGIGRTGGVWTEEATIEPGATRVFEQRSNAALPDGFVGTARVSVADGQSVVGLVAAADEERGVSTAYRLTPGAADATAPLVRRSRGGTEAAIQVVNLGQIPSTVVVTYRTPSGQTAMTQLTRLASGGVLTSIPDAPGLSEGFNGSATVASAEGQPLAVTVSHLRY